MRPGHRSRDRARLAGWAGLGWAAGQGAVARAPAAPDSGCPCGRRLVFPGLFEAQTRFAAARPTTCVRWRLYQWPRRYQASRPTVRHVPTPPHGPSPRVHSGPQQPLRSGPGLARPGLRSTGGAARRLAQRCRPLVPLSGSGLTRCLRAFPGCVGGRSRL